MRVRCVRPRHAHWVQAQTLSDEQDFTATVTTPQMSTKVYVCRMVWPHHVGVQPVADQSGNQHITRGIQIELPSLLPIRSAHNHSTKHLLETPGLSFGHTTRYNRVLRVGWPIHSQPPCSSLVGDQCPLPWPPFRHGGVSGGCAMLAGLRLVQHGGAHNKLIICEITRSPVKHSNDIAHTVLQNKQPDTHLCKSMKGGRNAPGVGHDWCGCLALVRMRMQRADWLLSVTPRARTHAAVSGM